MNTVPLTVLNTGLVTSVGLCAPATCTAVRAGLSNPTETHFIDSGGDPIMAHQVPLEQAFRGIPKLARMAVMAIEECLAIIPRREWTRIPLLLCVAENERPGRIDELDEELFAEIQHQLNVQFSTQSLLVPEGRTSVGTALQRARELVVAGLAQHILVASADSLVTWPTLQAYERADRLLTSSNSNGFIPGEGAAALLVGPAEHRGQLRLTGIGFATEPARVESDLPLRALGLAGAMRTGLLEAGCELDDIDFRISDVAGEQYYFKEAALALGRVLKKHRESFAMWHPAECIGETGATAGIVCLAIAAMSLQKKYAPGPRVLIHASADHGSRMAIVGRAD
jgi:3-oxoacyl-[acyl-carrier-protein] synthase I